MSTLRLSMRQFKISTFLDKAVFSPAYLRLIGPASLQHRFFFDVGKESFHVTTGYAQTMPSCHALNYSWGEH